MRMRISRAAEFFFLLFLFALLLSSTSLAATRHYYIAAEDVNWNYAPSGYNLFNGNVIPQPWSTSESSVRRNLR